MVTLRTLALDDAPALTRIYSGASIRHTTVRVASTAVSTAGPAGGRPGPSPRGKSVMSALPIRGTRTPTLATSHFERDRR